MQIQYRKELAPVDIAALAAEILNILVGSFGLVTVAPFTAVVSRLLYRRMEVTVWE
jgi:uncharacterized membrane protein